MQSEDLSKINTKEANNLLRKMRTFANKGGDEGFDIRFEDSEDFDGDYPLVSSSIVDS